MRYLSLLVFFPLVAICGLIDGNAVFSRETCTGIWAAGAKLPYLPPDFIPKNIPSPDGTLSIKATDESLLLVGRRNSAFPLDLLINRPLMEVLWSPDSRSFAINISDGGLVGTWDAKVYLVDSNDHPVIHDIQGLIKPTANELLQCEPREEANIGVASWLKGGEEVLMIAEVPPHSSCRNMGTIFGFRVSVRSGKIIERISEDSLRKNWANILGCRFVRIRNTSLK